MKTYNLIYTLGVVLILAASCQKQQDAEDSLAGTPVVFNAQIVSGPETKVQNSNWRDNKSGPVEYKWDNGDRVLLNESRTSLSNSEYTLSSGSWTSSSPITWGEAGTEHTFYGAYPANRVSLNGNVVEATLPNSMDGGAWTYFHMIAAKHVPEAYGVVDIPFTPFVTPIRIRIRNNKTYTVGLSHQSFSVTGDLPVSGDYRATIQPDGTCSFADGDLPYANASFTMSCSASTNIGANGGEWGFVFFILPQKYQELKFEMNLDGDKEITFKASDEGKEYFEPFATHVFHLTIN